MRRSINLVPVCCQVKPDHRRRHEAARLHLITDHPVPSGALDLHPDTASGPKWPRRSRDHSSVRSVFCSDLNDKQWAPIVAPTTIMPRDLSSRSGPGPPEGNYNLQASSGAVKSRSPPASHPQAACYLGDDDQWAPEVGLQLQNNE